MRRMLQEALWHEKIEPVLLTMMYLIRYFQGERSVAKTLLTLDHQTGKSTEEYAVATTLLNLSVEPVMSSGKHDVLQDQLEDGEPENRNVESTESIESQVTLESEINEKLTKDCGTQVS